MPRKFPPPDDDWWTCGPGKGLCRRCEEERLVTAVQDWRGVQHFCQVCGHSWWVSGGDRNWRD